MADLGDTLRFKSDVYDGSGALVNATTATLTITLPDGTTTSPTVANPPSTTGKYYCDYTTSLLSPSGRYVGQWLFTFAGGATTSYKETFDVGGSLVTVDEALAHLRASGVITTDPDLEQLQWLTFVATDAIERDLGRAIVPRTITESHDGGHHAITLRKLPVVAVTSITETGVALSSTYGYVPQPLPDGGMVIYRGSQLVPQYFWPGRQNIVVTYTVGYVDPPRIVRKVALNAIQDMWQESGPPRPLPSDIGSYAVDNAQSSLSPVEQGAYDSLRLVAIG